MSAKAIEMSDCKHEKGLGYEGECVPCLKAELAELRTRVKELQAVIDVRSIKIASGPLDVERWMSLSRIALVETQLSGKPLDRSILYWAFQTLAIQDSEITDKQASIAELENQLAALREAILNSAHGHTESCKEMNFAGSCVCGYKVLEALLQEKDNAD